MITAAHTLDLTRQHESTATNTFRLIPNPPVFVCGDGPWLITETNERYLDLVCGSSTTNLGHNHPAHKRAIEEALATGILHTGTRLSSPFRAALYEVLTSILPSDLNCIQLVNSGSEAIEVAIKAAQFATGRKRIVCFEGGYHGRTLGALSITSGEHIRAPFTTLDNLVDIVPYPSTDRNAQICLIALEDVLKQRMSENDVPAILVVEAIQGVSGVIGPDIEFLQGLQQLCRRFDVPLAIDEIWNGFGRTGRWFAFEHAKFKPDFVVMGKALSGGLPLSAVASSLRFLKVWPSGMHTSTFQGNPLACAMAVAGIETIHSEKLNIHVVDAINPLLQAGLSSLTTARGVRTVRTIGAMAAIELTDLDGEIANIRNTRFQRTLLKHRILAYGGGRNGECLILLPPININTTILETALETICHVITKDVV